MPVLPGVSPAPGAPYLRGVVGELHPDLVDAWEIRAGRIILAEVAIAGLAGGQLSAVRAAPVPRFPAVERDIAVVVPEERPAAHVAENIRRHGGDLLRDARLFDIYRGAPLGPDEKSLAYRLVFQAADRTLTEADLDGAVSAVTSGLATELGARLRA
jgi:phenylalanyl-tRNA synthetase beta chain